MIWSLAHKRGAFGARRSREDLFPSLAFRRAPQPPRRRGDRANLPLAASTGERRVELAPAGLIGGGEAFAHAAAKALCKPETPAARDLSIGAPELGSYDALLADGRARRRR